MGDRNLRPAFPQIFCTTILVLQIFELSTLDYCQETWCHGKRIFSEVLKVEQEARTGVGIEGLSRGRKGVRI